MRQSMLVRGAVAAASASLILTACGSEPDQPEAGSARAGSDLAAEAGSTEVDGPSPRLVLADADSGRVDIVDLTTEESLHSFEFEDATRLTTVNDRYVYAVNGKGNVAHVLEPGSWTIDHGDHTHSYTKDPTELGKLEGVKPAHVITGDRKVTTFFDGEGKAEVNTFGELSDGNADAEFSIAADAPQHGVAIPVDDHFLVSHSTTNPDDTRPGSFELRDARGEIVKTFGTPCPRMHGTAAFDKYAVAACDDGLFVASTDGTEWRSEKVPYPEGITPESRPTTFREQDSVPVLAATAGPAATNDGILAFDSATRGWTHIRTPDRALDVNLSGDGKTVFAVLADGTFRSYDVATAAETASAQALSEPFDWSDTSQAKPSVLVSGKRAYVSDPAGSRVQEIDYRDNARIARTLDAGFTVGSMSVVGE
ncbi:ABC transporter [Rhodococcus sp. NPDC058521]|uniref:ABC transporter n=1 Tax=Rhodococcus sp. NPDC058521 TaxID=3346536 RepID=UPI003656F14C